MNFRFFLFFKSPFSPNMYGFHKFLLWIHGLHNSPADPADPQVVSGNEVGPGRIDQGFPRAGEQDDGSLPQTHQIM